MKHLHLLLALLLVSFMATAQRPVLVAGDFSVLKGQKFVELEFTYDNILVGNKTEECYLSEKDEHFRNSWQSDRPNRSEPKFEELINKYTESKNISFSRGAKDSRYKMSIQTNWIAPGWYAGVTSAPSQISVTVVLFDKENNNAEVAKMTICKIPGASSMGMDMGARMQEAYAKCGKIIGKYFADKCL